MIICVNCGAINEDNDSRFCKKCGVLLPISSKPPRIQIPFTNLEKKGAPELFDSNQNKPTKFKKEKKNEQLNGEKQFFPKHSKNNQKKTELELQKIPKKEIESLKNSDIKPKKIDLNEIPSHTSAKFPKSKREYLPEITPRPFKSSIIDSKKIYKPLKTKSKNKPQVKQLTPKPVVNSVQKTQNLQESIALKRNRLEEDMLDVLKVLSKKLRLPKVEKVEFKSTKVEGSEKEIPPSNMNMILKQLLKLDLHIEASAIIKGEQILASAISSRISDRLLATIGQNLSMIGSDIIEGLSAGTLKSISLRGTDGILDLAPIDKDTHSIKDMSLMILSHPKVKSGIINFAVDIVKKQIKEYLGIDK